MVSHFQKCEFAVNVYFVRHFPVRTLQPPEMQPPEMLDTLKEAAAVSGKSPNQKEPVSSSPLDHPTATMLLPLLVLGLANFICGHILQTNLINGSFRYKVGKKTRIFLYDQKPPH